VEHQAILNVAACSNNVAACSNLEIGEERETLRRLATALSIVQREY
jgi:hypothetical protein